MHIVATFPERCFSISSRMYSRVTKVLAPWLNFIVQLASSQLPLMVPKAEMQSQETEPNFCPSHLIQAEEDIQSGKFEAFLSHHSVWGWQDFCYTTVHSSSHGYTSTERLLKGFFYYYQIEKIHSRFCREFIGSIGTWECALVGSSGLGHLHNIGKLTSPPIDGFFPTIK